MITKASKQEIQSYGHFGVHFFSVMILSLALLAGCADNNQNKQQDPLSDTGGIQRAQGEKLHNSASDDAEKEASTQSHISLREITDFTSEVVIEHPNTIPLSDPDSGLLYDIVTKYPGSFLGYNVWVRETCSITGFKVRSYYTIGVPNRSPEDLETDGVLLAESFGNTDSDAADYYSFLIPQLSSYKGQALVCNCVFGGDGARRVYVYKGSDSGVSCYSLDMDALELEDWVGQGALSYHQYFDPENEELVVLYQKNDNYTGECRLNQSILMDETVFKESKVMAVAGQHWLFSPDKEEEYRKQVRDYYLKEWQSELETLEEKLKNSSDMPGERLDELKERYEALKEEIERLRQSE